MFEDVIHSVTTSSCECFSFEKHDDDGAKQCQGTSCKHKQLMGNVYEGGCLRTVIGKLSLGLLPDESNWAGVPLIEMYGS